MYLVRSKTGTSNKLRTRPPGWVPVDWGSDWMERKSTREMEIHTIVEVSFEVLGTRPLP
jgi:hypothetical protein